MKNVANISCMNESVNNAEEQTYLWATSPIICTEVIHPIPVRVIGQGWKSNRDHHLDTPFAVIYMIGIDSIAPSSIRQTFDPGFDGFWICQIICGDIYPARTLRAVMVKDFC